MTYFTRFARETTKEYNFVAVACGMTSTSAAERKGLIHMITANSWREDGTITHYTSQCASSIYEATNHIWKNTTGGMSLTFFADVYRCHTYEYQQKILEMHVHFKIQ